MDSKDLHDEIMNIPCRRKDDSFYSTDSRMLYKEGHRDARHDAAALALAAAPQVVADERGTNEIDQAWDKAIKAEAISSQLRRENEMLLSALGNIINNPSQCVSIADQAMRFND